MSVLKPFRAYRPRPEQAREVASFPYDVISSEEARELARGNPFSFLHVCKPEIDLDPAIDVHDDRVYARGRENLRRLIAEGTLVRDASPCLYVYQQRMGEHVQVGLVGLCSVREYERDLIKKHEHTRPDKENDRTRHVTEANANAEPVFLAYRGARRDRRARRTPCAPARAAYDFVADDGIGHALWVVSDPAEIDALSRLFADVPVSLRGRRPPPHRRCRAPRPGDASAQPAAARRRAVRVLHGGCLSRTISCRSSTTTVSSKDLNGLTVEQFLRTRGGAVHRGPGRHGAAVRRPAPSACILGGTWHRLDGATGNLYPADDPVGGLDVSILQDNLLAPILGIADPRTDQRIDFVGGIRGTAELEKRCGAGGAVAFALYPTSLDQLMRVADCGRGHAAEVHLVRAQAAQRADGETAGRGGVRSPRRSQVMPPHPGGAGLPAPTPQNRPKIEDFCKHAAALALSFAPFTEVMRFHSRQ